MAASTGDTRHNSLRSVLLPSGMVARWSEMERDRLPGFSWALEGLGTRTRRSIAIAGDYMSITRVCTQFLIRSPIMMIGS